MSTAFIAVRWIVLTLVGFTAGSLLGATSGGRIPSSVPGPAGLVLGDLVFGACIGFSQWFALRDLRTASVSPNWIIAICLGFTLGARSGAKFTPILVEYLSLPPSVVFGFFMGGTIGVATAMTPRFVRGWTQVPTWLAISVLAWVLGEQIAFWTNFSQPFVPLVGLAITSVTGWGLAVLSRQKPPNPDS